MNAPFIYQGAVESREILANHALPGVPRRIILTVPFIATNSFLPKLQHSVSAGIYFVFSIGPDRLSPMISFPATLETKSPTMTTSPLFLSLRYVSPALFKILLCLA